MHHQRERIMQLCLMLFDSDVPLLTALAIATLIVILAGSSPAKNKRPTQLRERPHACPGCGTVHPQYASFCRRCGQRLD
jgi:hypothetical protein